MRNERLAVREMILKQGVECRRTPRVSLMLRVAKIVVDGREFLSVLSDVSETGARIRLFHPLPHHEVLELELDSGERLVAEIAWREDDCAGLNFSRQTDIKRLIYDCRTPFPRRQVRLRVSVEAHIHTGRGSRPITVRNISQQGAEIECGKFLLINELVRIDLPSLTPIYAKVRWRSKPLYGLVFEQTFKLDELARAAVQLQLG